ncbi:MAG: hypothetical protein QE570_06725 [Verrucomicrobiota bacterium]|jgi:hypothetical protein|nr:hypothetical protein [Verrucomicrobiaceae bacterium]MDH4452855.1 hypothetical protein [Verrucomicrobiota bacterium]
MSSRRRLPFPDLPERRRSRIHWPTLITILVLGIALVLVIRAVQRPSITDLPNQTSPTPPVKKPIK